MNQTPNIDGRIMVEITLKYRNHEMILQRWEVNTPTAEINVNRIISEGWLGRCRVKSIRELTHAEMCKVCGIE